MSKIWHRDDCPSECERPEKRIQGKGTDILDELLLRID